ncbi:hypothetical protein WJX79_002215 [Trebouxia sp. C0005]
MKTSIAGTRLATPAKLQTRTRAATPVAASLRQDVARVAKGGGLAFDPSTVTIKAGESVTWTNNVGFPHNVVFDEDDIPEGVDANSLSHEDYLNSPGQKVSSKFSKPGTYGYYCEPHQGAGMVGKVVVQ